MPKNFRQYYLCLTIFIISINGFAGSFRIDSTKSEDTVMLLSNVLVQVEATAAVNALYNFQFSQAEHQFTVMKYTYEDHPLPYFLLGLSEWWKIMPNLDNEKYDEGFLAYMDSTIDIANKRFKNEEHKVEAAFFLAAAYGFKGRLFSERRSWRKATFAGKNALKYLEESKKSEVLSPELLFGEALYNYYSVWIPENYPILKPVLMFFEKGDKDLGIEQLREVSNNAFYTRTEAQLFLMRILANEENNKMEALPIAEYLNLTFPNNAYFQRFYARLLYSFSMYDKLEPVSMDIIAKIDSGQVGYEATSGRYASFFLAEMYRRKRNPEKATIFYSKAVAFAEETEAFESGYYIYSLLNLGKLVIDKDNDLAYTCFDKITDNTKKKHPANKQAKRFLKELSKKRKKK